MHKDQLTLYGNLYSKQHMVAAGPAFQSDGQCLDGKRGH